MRHLQSPASPSAKPETLQFGSRGVAKSIAASGGGSGVPLCTKSAALSALAHRVWYPCSQYSSPASAGLLFPIPPISHHHSHALPQRNLRLRPSQTCSPIGGNRRLRSPTRRSAAWRTARSDFRAAVIHAMATYPSAICSSARRRRGRFEARKGCGRKKKPRQSGAGSGMWVTKDDFPSRCSTSSLTNLATMHE